MAYLLDKTTLCAYSSDASIYNINPSAVVKIQNSRDILQAVTDSLGKKQSVIPRGGGTGLVGGALGDGLILDFSGFNNILVIDPAGLSVQTQVGIIYEELNRVLKKFGLFFPPDPSSGDTCQIGGMIANNSSGPRSIKYGLTSDFVDQISVVNSKGKLVYLKKLKLQSDKLNKFLADNSEYNQVLEILQKNSSLIKNKWPKVKKNSAGYNLLQVVDDLERDIFNLPALIVGSEGTLNIVVSAKLKLLPLPREKLTTSLYFRSLVAAGKAVEPLLKIKPSGLEIVDGATLDLIGREKFEIPDQATALLIVEFDENIEAKKEEFLDLASGLDLAGPVDFAYDPESAAALWKARKAIVPTLYRHHPSKRPISLVEDISLPPKEIPTFIEYVSDLFGQYNLTFGMFGHIGDGNLHIRPLFDLNKKEDFDLARKIYHEVYEKVISIGGSTTAEHADGRLRAQVLKKMYGEEIYEIFKSIKNSLDPDNLFSPGSIISEQSFTENIDFKKLESYCAACGKCNGYCPAFEVFKREDYSPRGWLRLLNQSNEPRRKLNKHFAFCLNCKNCATVCPAGVDIASEILKFRSEKPSLISGAIVRAVDFEPLFNLSLKLNGLIKPVISSSAGRKLLGLDKAFEFPNIAKESLRKRYSERVAQSGDVAFFHGCADNLLASDVGEAVFNVFDNLVIDVKMPLQKCCGLPQEVYGHKDNLISKAKFNIDQLADFNSIISGCASCIHRLREYKKLFEDNSEYYEKACLLETKCQDISQYLNTRNIDYKAFEPENELKITYHNPCHLRAAGLHNEPIKLVKKIKNIKIHHPDYADCCCGQAGSYGYTHYKESKRIFARKREEYYDIGAQYIMTSCPACKLKINMEMSGNFEAVHPIELLNKLLKNKTD